MFTLNKPQFNLCISHYICRQAFRNIYDLLKPEGGDCLLSFQPYMPIFDIYEALKDTSTWSPYLGHIDYFTGPLQRIEEDELLCMVQNAGFYNIHIEYTYEVQNYESAQEFTGTDRILDQQSNTNV